MRSFITKDIALLHEIQIHENQWRMANSQTKWWPLNPISLATSVVPEAPRLVVSPF